MTQFIFQAQPFELPFDPHTTVLVMIGMQRDFVEAGGFGEVPGNDVSLVHTIIALCTGVLTAARQKGIMVIRTREGRHVGLNDCPPVKLTHGGKAFTGEPGPMGRILVRGEADHGITPELYPVANEPVIDKPSKGALYHTDLHLVLQDHGIKTLVVCGIIAEAYVTTTTYGVNGRGYECIIPEGRIDFYFPELQEYTPEVIKARDAIFSWAADPEAVVTGLED